MMTAHTPVPGSAPGGTPTDRGLLSRARLPYLGLALGIVLALLSLRATTSGIGSPSWRALRDAVTLSSSVLLESFPFVVVGIAISVLVRVWVSSALFDRLIPSNRALRRIVMSLVGTFLPVCECGNVPLARGFLSRGMSVGDVVAFTLAAPLLNPVTIITTYQAFGTENGILWGRVLGGFIIAQIAAILVTWRIRPEALLAPRFAQACQTQGAENADGDRIGRSLAIFARESATLLPALVLGSMLAGLIQVGVRRDVLTALGHDPVLSVLAILALAFIVSICSSVDAFFALALASVFLPGALTAFLVFGAMVDIKMIALLRTTLSGRAVARIVAVVTLCCVILGLGVNYGVA